MISFREMFNNLSILDKYNLKWSTGRSYARDQIYIIPKLAMSRSYTEFNTPYHISIHENTWNACQMFHLTYHEFDKYGGYDCSIYYQIKTIPSSDSYQKYSWQYDDDFKYAITDTVIPSCTDKRSVKTKCHIDDIFIQMLSNFVAFLNELSRQKFLLDMRNKIVAIKKPRRSRSRSRSRSRRNVT